MSALQERLRQQEEELVLMETKCTDMEVDMFKMRAVIDRQVGK
jgi:hypothetical protein